jgi:hypothetical protein
VWRSGRISPPPVQTKTGPLTPSRAGHAAARDPSVGVGAADLFLQLLRTAVDRPCAGGCERQHPGGGGVGLGERFGDLENRSKTHVVAAEPAWLVESEEARLGECIDHLVGLSAFEFAVAQPISQQFLNLHRTVDKLRVRWL